MKLVTLAPEQKLRTHFMDFRSGFLTEAYLRLELKGYGYGAHGQ